MQRRLNALTKLKARVVDGSMKANDATHRALQMLESTPQPVRLQEPRLAKLSQQLINLAANAAKNDNTTQVIQSRLDRLKHEDDRVSSQLKESSTQQPTITPEASKAAGEQKLRGLLKLHTSLSNGSLSASEATHRALQIVENTTEHVRAAEPRLLDICQQLLFKIVDPSTKRYLQLQNRFQRLKRHDISPETKVNTPTPQTAPFSPLVDTSHYVKLYKAFDRFQYRKAFELLSQISGPMWQRTPHSNRNQILKVATTAMASTTTVATESTCRHYLNFIQAVHRVKGLPPNWINQPTTCTAMTIACSLTNDPTPLLQLYKAQDQLSKKRGSKGIFRSINTPTSNSAQILPPSTSLFVAIVDVLAAVHKQSSLPEFYKNFSGQFNHGCLVAMVRVLTLPESSPYVALIAAELPLQAFVDCQYQAPLLRALIKCDLVFVAQDYLIQMLLLGQKVNARRIPSSVQTDVLVELYKLRAYDRFHSAYEELWSRGYQVGLLEFRALSDVVPASVLQDLLGQKEYETCLHEAQRQASRKAQRVNHKITISKDDLDLRSAPASMCASLLNLHLHSLDDLHDVVIYVSDPIQSVVVGELNSKNIPFVDQRPHQILISAHAIHEFLKKENEKRVRESVLKFIALRGLVVYSVVVGGITIATTFN